MRASIMPNWEPKLSPHARIIVDERAPGAADQTATRKLVDIEVHERHDEQLHRERVMDRRPAVDRLKTVGHTAVDAGYNIIYAPTNVTLHSTVRQSHFRRRPKTH